MTRRILALALVAGGCNNPGAGQSTSAKSIGIDEDSIQNGCASPTSRGVYAWGLDESLGIGGGTASPIAPANGGSLAVTLGPPYGTSTTCGDAIVGVDQQGKQEECDDGGDGAPDACTAQCQTRDQPVVSNQGDASRTLGAGRHPVAGLLDGFINVFVDSGMDQPQVGARVFNIWGQPMGEVVVSDGANPITTANPVAAALPGGKYAVAWSDFDGDGSDLGVALRSVAADGALGPLRAANAAREFSQLNPDMLWTGSQLIVAWEDYADPANGPDLRFRRFDSELNPVGEDESLAASELPEAAVALATFEGGWAAAYREGTADGRENIVVRVGDDTFRAGPVQGGPLDDRPALLELDATHLLVVFSAGTDPAPQTGTYNIPRIRYAVVDINSSTAPQVLSLDPLDDIFMSDTLVSHLSPAAALGSDGLYVAWRSEARPGDAAGDQIWLKYLTWNAASSPQLQMREQEMLLPRTGEANIGDQRVPQLARVGLPPNGALAVAWEDYSHNQGVGDPDVVVHYAPTHLRDAAARSLVTEKFTGPDGPGWPSQWSIDPSATLSFDNYRNEGRVQASALGSTIAYVNNHTARDVELLAKVRVVNNGISPTLIARRTDAEPGTYLGFRIGTSTTDVARVFTVVNGTRTDINTLALPYIFQSWAQNLDIWVRFRVKNDSSAANSSIAISGKWWLASLPEPIGWTVSGTVPAGSTFASRVGRFGLQSNQAQSNRTLYVDDFSAKFFEGSLLGDPSGELTPSLPLLRSAASYRVCTGTAPCSEGEACCSDDSECAAGLTCATGFGEFEGLGSHAKTCVPSHCINKVMDADEVRADCGGNDCQPCTCTATTTPGGASYCTAACPCGYGGTDCSTSADCLPGLFCAQEKGYRYGWIQGSDACVPTYCQDRIQDGDETGVDTGGSCGPIACFPSENGGYQHCSQSCPCPKGEGNVNYKDQCQGTLVVGAGARWGYAFDVCVPVHCANNKKDADETGKDCGGADCGPICP